MKQTAVEWLFEKINNALIDFSEGKISAAVYGIRATEYKYQAKQMEKEQSERMYSEEDLRNAYRWGTTVNHGTKEHFNEWFEQLKKKSYDKTTDSSRMVG